MWRVGELFGRCNEWLQETALMPSDSPETRLCHSHHEDTKDDEPGYVPQYCTAPPKNFGQRLRSVRKGMTLPHRVNSSIPKMLLFGVHLALRRNDLELQGMGASLGSYRRSRKTEGLILRTGRSRTELEKALGPKGQVRALDGTLHRLHPDRASHATKTRRN